jgi:hypothetical protein
VTLLAIQKTSMTSSFANVTYTDASGVSYTAYAYQYYNAALVAQLGTKTTANKITAYYSNPSTFNSASNNSTDLTFYGFVTSGTPSAPQSVTPTTVLITGSSTTGSINLAWSAPQYADADNPGEGTISSYDISYNTTGSTIRYNSGITQSGTSNSISGLSSTLSSLYPDASYSIVVLATNNSSLKGPYSTTITGYSSYLPAPTTLSTIALNTADSYSTSTTIFKVNGQVSIGSVPLIKVSTPITTTSFIIPIHKQANRGKLQGTGTIMTLSSALNGTAGPSVQYTGFPATAPATGSSNNLTVTTTGVEDYYTSTTPQGGFYLKSTNTITIDSAGFIKRSSTPNTLSAQQTFYDTSTSSSATVDFYYDTPITTGPTGAVNAVNISPSYFAKVSGLSILYGTPIITIDASANNMGSYFYRSPLITYTYTNSTNTGTKSETNLAAVQSSDINLDKFSTGNLSFNSSYTSSTLASIYSQSIKIDASANNIFGAATLTSKTINVITDGPSYTLVYSTLSATIPTLTANTLTNGYRIWSAPSVSNNCPDLLYNGTTAYLDISYNNTWNITTTNQSGYDATTELLISNGQFTTVRSAYLDYNAYVGNSGFNYSSISATGYRFASFCWKLNASNNSYTSLSFTINSIYNATIATDGSKLLQMNGVKVPVFYAFQDTSSTSYNSTTFNSVWINANSNINGAGSANFYLSANTYGVLGGITSAAVTLNGSNATINAFIPAINPVKNSIYLYLRIAVPMNTDIKFGSVSAKIG